VRRHVELSHPLAVAIGLHRMSTAEAVIPVFQLGTGAPQTFVCRPRCRRRNTRVWSVVSPPATRLRVNDLSAVVSVS